MKPFVCLIASGLVICILSGCSPRPGASGDVADAGESPAASLTAAEAAAYASYAPVMSMDGDSQASEADSQ